MTDRLRVARRMLAETTAADVLRDQKVSGLWVDPMAIAAAKGIMIQAKPDSAAGVSGMLVKVGDDFGIMYATHIPSRGFQRFSVAHELGHYFMSGHSDALLADGFHVSHAGFMSADPYEQEADFFAAALLMPERAFRLALDEHAPGLACIDALHSSCETSLTATAIRYNFLTRDGVAIIMSEGDTIDWCFMSDGLKQAKGLTYLRKGTPLPTSTATADFNVDPDNIASGKRASGDGLLNDWMDGDRSYRVTEEVVGLGHYGRTLTVLTCSSLSQRPEAEEDEDEEEAALTESWTPRFRK